MSDEPTAEAGPALLPILPPGWPRPSGFANGILAPANARTLYVAGQIAWDEKHTIVGPGDFLAQFRQALANVVTVVKAAGGEPKHLASLTVYVTDSSRYVEAVKAVGDVWRALVGRHYPAMALVEVKGLLEPGALVEIQAVAAIPPATQIDA